MMLAGNARVNAELSWELLCPTLRHVHPSPSRPPADAVLQ